MINNEPLGPVVHNFIQRLIITAPTNSVSNNVFSINCYKHRYNEFFEVMSGKFNVAGLYTNGNNAQKFMKCMHSITLLAYLLSFV
jgi:hypothetical protein